MRVAAMTTETSHPPRTSTMAAAEPSPTPMATATMDATMSPSPYYEEPPAAMEAVVEDLPDHPSRDQVQAALTAVRPAVAACTNGQHGTARVLVTVASSGRVTTAQVQDEMWARPPTGSCIARAVRGARFPRFSEDRFRVMYPFAF